MQTTSRRLSVVLATSCARRRLIRDIRPTAKSTAMSNDQLNCDDADVQRRRMIAADALRFLALTKDELIAYIWPLRFPPVRFHLSTGDMETTYAIQFMVAFAYEALGVLCDDGLAEDSVVHVRRLRALLSFLGLHPDDRVWRPDHWLTDSDLDAIWTMVRELAVTALTRFDFAAGRPSTPSRSVLNEYSYGAYSASVHSSA